MRMMKRSVIFPMLCFSSRVNLLSILMIFISLKWQILPTGTPWIPHLVGVITEVVLNGSKSIFVDKKLIEGPNPNDRGKFLIPLVLAFQVSPLNLFYFINFFPKKKSPKLLSFRCLPRLFLCQIQLIVSCLLFVVLLCH